MTIFEEALDLKDYTIQHRRDFHKHPELGFQEHRSAKIIADELKGLGLEVTTGVGTTGVVGLLKGRADYPVVLLRFDMDALPILEENEVDYASEDPGKMHACGHDSHMAVGLTVARLLAARKDQLPGTIKFVFQRPKKAMAGPNAWLRRAFWKTRSRIIPSQCMSGMRSRWAGLVWLQDR